MPRLVKLAIFGFLAYAVVTATPARQAEIVEGLLAVKEAAVDACEREGGLCARAIDTVTTAVNGSLSDANKPWLDEDSKRAVPTSGNGGTPVPVAPPVGHSPRNADLPRR